MKGVELDQLDILRELSTIGAGNAAGAISKMVGKRVDISVPSTYWARMEEVTRAIGISQLMVGVIVRIDEKKAGHVILLLEEDDALSLVRLLTGPGVKELGDLERSALMEVGNILTGTFIGALSRFLRTSIKINPPFMRVSPLLALLNDTLGGRKSNENLWLATVKFLVDGGTSKGYILFIPLFDFRGDAMERIATDRTNARSRELQRTEQTQDR